MGWFSRTGSSKEEVKADKAPEEAIVTPTEAAAASIPIPEPSTSSAPSPSVPEATATRDELPPLPIGSLVFEEYKEPEDVFDRFKVGEAMNELAACSSLGANIRNYYRYGTFKDCAARYDHLKFCLKIKTKTSQVGQVMIQRRDAEINAKKASQPNSEDVWTARTHPPQEFVELARQAQE